jgi:hypothetical protein
MFEFRNTLPMRSTAGETVTGPPSALKADVHSQKACKWWCGLGKSFRRLSEFRRNLTMRSSTR